MRHNGRLVSFPKSAVARPPAFPRSASPSRRSFGNFAAPQSLLSESRSKEVFISGGAIDPSPRSRRAKREAAKLCATNGIKQRERGKEWEGGEGSTTQSAFPPSSPVLMLLPFPFLTAGRSIGSRKRCTRNWPRPQTATYRASCPLPPSACTAHAKSRFFPSERARQEQSYKQSCNRK